MKFRLGEGASEMWADGYRRALVAATVLTLVIAICASSSALAAGRHVYHQQGASAGAFFNSCPTVADGQTCAFTIVAVSTARSAQDQRLSGDCVYVEQYRGFRQGPNSLTATSNTTVSNVCGQAKVVIPRALGGATATGTLPTIVCDYLTGACAPGRTTIDIRWTGVGTISRATPFTSRYYDYDFGLPCVYHALLGKMRDATVSAAITNVDPLGPAVPGEQLLASGGDTFIGQNVDSCID
jgi:hypothetical protein